MSNRRIKHWIAILHGRLYIDRGPRDSGCAVCSECFSMEKESVIRVVVDSDNAKWVRENNARSEAPVGKR